MKKYCLAVLAALALAACGSSGKKVANDFTDKLLPTPKPGAGLKTMDLSEAKQDIHDSKVVITLGGKTYQTNELGKVDISEYLPNEVKALDYAYKAERYNGLTDDHISESGKAYLYKNQYSVVLGRNIEKIGERPVSDQRHFEIAAVRGEPTAQLPTAGVYSYAGQAFHKDKTGRLQYKVDFDNRTGEGNITGLSDTGEITLTKSEINKRYHQVFANNADITGVATSTQKGNGDYYLRFFGKDADEIAGMVDLESSATQVGFGGTKQPSISK